MHKMIPALLVFASSLTTQACAGRAPASGAALQTVSHTASEAGFLVNSHLIYGEREALLVDAQFTRSEARKVVEMVRATGRELKTIFITHGHPDHYLGLEILTREFPRAQVLARPAVIADIQASAPGKLAYWKPIYKDDLADAAVVPTAFTGASLSVDGQAVELVELPEPGESEHATALFIPASGTLLTGDLAYNDVHLWLVENRPQGWLKNLDRAEKIGATRILPGHGANSDRSVLALDRSYIEKFAAGASQAELATAYPEFKLPVILELSIGARK
jgi:glyoxylase-like metal-dependent hydrolase (beta-lactamase superfamily II)